MGEGHGWRLGPAVNLIGQSLKKRRQTIQDQVQRISQPDCISVVLNVHRGGAQMQDRPADRTIFGVGTQFGHQVVPDLGLNLMGALDVHLVYVGAQVGHLLGRHQPQGVLGLGQCQPDASPEPPLVRITPQLTHRVAPIAPGEGG